MSPTITALSDKNNRFIELSIIKGRDICKKQITAQDFTPKQLDQVFLHWANNQGNTSTEDIANGLGALFGDMLTKNFKFSWKMVTDDYSTEYALIDDITGSIIFPINALWKRIEPKLNKEDFFVPMWTAIENHLKEESK